MATWEEGGREGGREETREGAEMMRIEDVKISN
jgi:hypothetical protein